MDNPMVWLALALIALGVVFFLVAVCLVAFVLLRKRKRQVLPSPSAMPTHQRPEPRLDIIEPSQASEWDDVPTGVMNTKDFGDDFQALLQEANQYVEQSKGTQDR